MTDLALKVSDLTKNFKVWNRPSDMLVEMLTARQRHTDFCALDGVSFELAPGKVLGVLGRNGAGKSTLLRLIAGTLDPTRGSVSINGRIASILELGTGFHADYSGRENIYLGGMCLGLSRSEIKARFDEIVEFAELAEFIERPFRTYSTGMQARLTFAVATSMNPDILIIDEALSVGDARFTLKSFDRIQNFRRQGKAILLVSHDINTVSAFCDQAILLERGKLIANGAAATVANIYHELLFGPPRAHAGRQSEDAGPVALAVDSLEKVVERAQGEESAPTRNPIPDPGAHADAGHSNVGGGLDDDGEVGAQPSSEQYRRYGDHLVEIVRFRILSADGRTVERLKPLSPYRFHMRLRARASVSDVGVGVVVRTMKGIQVFAANSLEPTPTLMRSLSAGEELDIIVPFEANMGHGVYFASAAAARVDGHKHDVQFDVLQFSVEQTGYHDESIANLNMTFEIASGAQPVRIQRVAARG